jgi:hypothetical protein
LRLPKINTDPSTTAIPNSRIVAAVSATCVLLNRGLCDGAAGGGVGTGGGGGYGVYPVPAGFS